MNEDYEGNVDMTAQATEHSGKEGYVPDELLAADVEDQDGSESPTEPDLSQPMFAYTGEDGQEVKFTGAQVLEAIENQKLVAELQAKLDEAQKQPAQPAVQPQAPAVSGQQDVAETVIPEKIGPLFASMLEGLDGGVEAIGPAFLRIVDLRINQILKSRDQATEARNTFTQDFSDFDESFNDGRLGKFLQEKPFYKQGTPYEAYLAMKALDERREVAALKAQLEDFESGKVKAVGEAQKKAKDDASKEILAHKKAAGSLRLLGGGTGTRPPAGGSQKKAFTDPDQRTEAALAKLAAIRAQTTAS